MSWVSHKFSEIKLLRGVDVSDKPIEEAAASILSAYQTGKKPT
jgi:hypothetical protein